MMEKPLFDMDNEVWSVDDHDSWGRIVAIHPRTNGEWWYVVRATWAWEPGGYQEWWFAGNEIEAIT